jgi:RNA polymerase-binding transcription factor DksA
MDTVTARQRLEDIRAEIDRSITVLTGEHDREDRTSGYPQDQADAGSNLSESDRSEAMLAAAKVQRTEVLNALHRIEAGTYGTCADCGAVVPEGRLEARPEAARCVKCQAKRDRMQR